MGRLPTFFQVFQYRCSQYRLVLFLSLMFDTDRRLIDPENHYPSDCLRQVEQYALDVLQLLPGARVSRTRDVIQLEVGAEEGDRAGDGSLRVEAVHRRGRGSDLA